MRITDSWERREVIYNYLVANGDVRIDELVHLTEASRPTISKDLYYIERYKGIPLKICPGNGGGVKINFEIWKPSIKYLSREKEEMIKNCVRSLNGELKRDLLFFLLDHCNPNNRDDIIHEFIDIYA